MDSRFSWVHNEDAPLISYCEHGEHGLSDVECVSPIMVDHGSIVLLNAEHVTTKGLLRDSKSFQEIQFGKHAYAGQNGFIVRENHVIELPGIQPKLIRFRKGDMSNTLDIVIGQRWTGDRCLSGDE